MTELHIDFETRSNIDLRKSGVFRYAEDKTTSVICAAYAFGEEEPELWIAGQPMPERIKAHVQSGGLVYAHNAQFERTLWESCLPWHRPEESQWRCTAAMAACLALPRDLARAAKALGLSEQKDDTGRRVMLKLCQPKSVNSITGECAWWEDPKDLAILYAYCKQDVRVERELTKRLRPLSDREQKIWSLDQRINKRGVLVDRAGVLNAKIITDLALKSLNVEISQITEGYVSSITQAEAIKQWCGQRGVALESVDKYALADILKDDSIDSQVRKVLLLRQQGAKSSTAKLKAYQERASLDGRMRDNLMYYGANTGRWSGRGAQLQNLPRSKLQDIPEAIEEMKFRDPARLALFYGPPLEVVSDCLRGFVVAPKGKKLISADFSNIEGRVLAWLSGHEDLVEKFRVGGKIYEEMAAAIYGIPASAVKKGSKERHLGKEAVLGGGYGMGKNRFQLQCARQGLTINEDLAARTIEVYRAKNEPIVEYWGELERAAFMAITSPGKLFKAGRGDRAVAYATHGNILWCKLPGGRFLTYPDPQIRMLKTPWGADKETVTYMTIDGLTNQWTRDKTYGGKLAENVTSGVARDIMCEAMLALENAGYTIVLTVHDEIVCEVMKDFGSVDDMVWTMTRVPDWAAGLPLAAEGYEAARYRK